MAQHSYLCSFCFLIGSIAGARITVGKLLLNRIYLLVELVVDGQVVSEFVGLRLIITNGWLSFLYQHVENLGRSVL